ncbi:MAG: hypothetical protein E7599_00100 [Ruminococcaceae bacterium]|nr:hypothetical protein [Oscillospiraceae bacterium]
MKISSVIFLVVGLVISITGYIVCGVAESMAKSAGGYDLLFEYNYDEEGNIVKEYEFSKDTIIETDAEGNEVKKHAVRKVSLTFTDMDILVVGGADRSRVVFQNMSEGSYYYHISNNVLYVTNHFTLPNFLQSEGLSFDGMRKYLNTSKYDGKKQVILYVEDADELKQYDFKLNNCRIELENINGAYDMRLEAKSSTVTMKNCSTESTLRLTLDKCKTVLDTVDYIETLIKGSGGELTYNDTAIPYLFRYDIRSEGGSLNLNGVDQSSAIFQANLSGSDYHSLSLDMTGTKLTVYCNG